MKKTIWLLLALIMLFVPFAVSAEVIFQNGDVNGDNEISLIDVTVLRRFLADGAATAAGNADVDGDGSINLKDVTVLRRYLAGGWGIELPTIPTEPINPTETPEPTEPMLSIPDADLQQYPCLTYAESSSGIVSASFSYGTSTQGRDLICWTIHPQSYSRTVYLNFEIHGWEDSYAGDGRILVELGNALVKFYTESDALYGCRLLIVPSCNPDGLEEGITNNGFGRCNASGIDLNRDFDASHVPTTSARNFTLSPFSAAETQAMRDLILATVPNVVIDFHGWENSLIGNYQLAEAFSIGTGIGFKKTLTDTAHGYFSYWAQCQGAEALLVEFKDPGSVRSGDVIAALNRILSGGYKKADYPQDVAYQSFDAIKSYALTAEKHYVQRQVGNTSTDFGYIDGSDDECTIREIYENGWCKVAYPLTNGYIKTGFCRLSVFIEPGTEVTPYSYSPAQTTTVYRTSSAAVKYGSVWTTDKLTVVAQKGDMMQVIYPLDDGGYKMGWIIQ